MCSRITGRKGGLAPGMKIVGVNGRAWSAEALHEAIAETRMDLA